MKNKPKVSVLVTFHNQEEYVDRALSSILDQTTDFNMEIIVGDDGSDDSTLDKIQNWMIKYPDIIELVKTDEENRNLVGGFRASRNRINLLRKVTGDYFIYLDGDDYYTDKYKLQKQVSILENENNKDCIACAHSFWLEYNDGRREEFGRTKFPEGKYDIREYWAKMYCHTNTLLVRSSIIPEFPVDLLENWFDDSMITFCALRHGLLYYIPCAMIVYSQTGDGIWTSGNNVQNWIREMMCYDLNNIIDPDLFQETSERYSYIWMNLFRNRKQISAERLQPYLKEAQDKGLRCAKKWILYNELNFFQKAGLIRSAAKRTRKKIIKAYMKELKGNGISH